MEKNATYLEMISDALMTLKERKGSSRQALWKCVASKYDKADYKQFLVRLKKITQSGKEIIFEKQRYKFNANYKGKLQKAAEQGKSLKNVHKTKATMKKSKRKQMKRSSKNKGKKSAMGKGKRSTRKSNRKSMNKKGGQKKKSG